VRIVPDSLGLQACQDRHLVSIFGRSARSGETPPGTRGTVGAGLTSLRADVVKDMVYHHSFRETCGKRRYLGMDVSQPGGAGPPSQLFDKILPDVV
jgi:hypothetical protein